MWTYDLTDKYKDNLEMLSTDFPEAYRFLNDIENLGDKGFHMETAVNMHCYYKENFLFYFVFRPKSSNKHYVRFSSEYNLRLKSDTISKPEMFFVTLVEMLSNSNLPDDEKVEIVMKLGKDGSQAYRINVYQFDGCKEFFDMCREVIGNI